MGYRAIKITTKHQQAKCSLPELMAVYSWEWGDHAHHQIPPLPRVYGHQIWQWALGLLMLGGDFSHTVIGPFTGRSMMGALSQKADSVRPSNISPDISTLMAGTMEGASGL